MGELKSDSEILAEIYRNAQLGVVSITDILPEVDNERIKECETASSTKITSFISVLYRKKTPPASGGIKKPSKLFKIPQIKEML